MKIKLLLSLSLMASIFIAGCSSKCIEDSGNHIIKDITVKPFNEINISGPVKLILVQDSSFAVKISADSNIMDKINASVSGDTFKIKLDPLDYCGTDSIVLHAGIGALKEIKAAGNSKVFSERKLNVGDLDLKLSGATDVNLDLNAGKLNTKVDGAARITLSGQAGAHNLESKGTLDLNAFSFVVGKYNIEIEGSGKSNINVLNDLKVNTSGVSSIYYKGSPKNVSEKKSGTGKLEKVN